MGKKEYFRKVLEKCVSNFIFSDCIDIQKAVENSHYSMANYFAKTEEEKATVEILFSIIEDIAKQYNSSIKKYSKEQIRHIIRGLDTIYTLNLKQYSDKQLLEAVNLISRECNNGCYTSDFGVLWCGKWQLDELKKLYKEIKEGGMTPTEKLKELILTGDILEQLKKDFPGIKLQDKQEYIGYIKEYYRDYASNAFAIYGDYKLELVCTGMMDTESIVNRTCKHLSLNKYIGFRLINTKTAHIRKVSNYSDIKRILKNS